MPPQVFGSPAGDGPLMTSGTGNVAPLMYSSCGFFGLTAISGSPIVRMLPFPVRFISSLPGGPADGSGGGLPSGVLWAEADIVTIIGAAATRHAINVNHRARTRRTCISVTFHSFPVGHSPRHRRSGVDFDEATDLARDRLVLGRHPEEPAVSAGFGDVELGGNAGGAQALGACGRCPTGGGRGYRSSGSSGGSPW